MNEIRADILFCSSIRCCAIIQNPEVKYRTFPHIQFVGKRTPFNDTVYPRYPRLNTPCKIYEILETNKNKNKISLVFSLY